MAESYREKLYEAATKLDTSLHDLWQFAVSLRAFLEVSEIKLPICEVIAHQTEAFNLLDGIGNDLKKAQDIIKPMQMYMLCIQEASTVEACKREVEPTEHEKGLLKKTKTKPRGNGGVES